MTGIDSDSSLLRSFIRFDLGAAAFALALCVAAQLVYVREPAFWLVPGSLAALVTALAWAGRQLRSGKVSVALGLVAGGNWIVALAVPVALPFMWPVLAVTAIVPVVLAAPYLGGRAMTSTIGIGAVLIGGVAVVGLLGDDRGVIDDIDDTFELVLVVTSLAALLVPIGLVITQANRLQRQSLDRAGVLNDELRSSERALAASRRRVVDAADTERIRIERDLHDGAQQRLVALGVHLRLLQSRIGDDETPEDLPQYVSMLVDELDRAVDELRELAHGIYPPLLEARGLVEALGAVARRSPVPLTITADDVGRFDPSTETALYFIALEAVANVSKHAPDSRASIRLESAATHLVLEIADDGPGFDDSVVVASKGMLNMSDRVASIDGTFVVDAAAGRGTRVITTVPLDASG